MHTIRLHGPWHSHLLAGSAGPATTPEPTDACGAREPLVVRIPVTRAQLEDPDCGPWLLLRRFGRPTGLDAGTRVELVLEQLANPASVRLNGEVLVRAHGDSILRRDVTRLLAPRNVLEIELGPLDGPASVSEIADSDLLVDRPRAKCQADDVLLGQVRLEIFES